MLNYMNIMDLTLQDWFVLKGLLWNSEEGTEFFQGQLEHESGPSDLSSDVLIKELPKLFNAVIKIIWTNVINKVSKSALPVD